MSVVLVETGAIKIQHIYQQHHHHQACRLCRPVCPEAPTIPLTIATLLVLHLFWWLDLAGGDQWGSNRNLAESTALKRTPTIVDGFTRGWYYARYLTS